MNTPSTSAQGPVAPEELAKQIARVLTDQHEAEVAVRIRQAELPDPKSGEYQFAVSHRKP